MSEIAVSEGGVSEIAVSEGGVSEIAVSEGVVSEIAVSEGGVSEGVVSEIAVSEGVVSEGVVSERALCGSSGSFVGETELATSNAQPRIIASTNPVNDRAPIRARHTCII